MICELCNDARVIPGLWGDQPCPDCQPQPLSDHPTFDFLVHGYDYPTTESGRLRIYGAQWPENDDQEV